MTGPRQDQFEQTVWVALRRQRNANFVGSQRLEKLYAEYGMDLVDQAVDDLLDRSEARMRELIRTIAVSETYGLSSGTVPGNERDTRLFSHQIPRALSAHCHARMGSCRTCSGGRIRSAPGHRRERVSRSHRAYGSPFRAPT